MSNKWYNLGEEDDKFPNHKYHIGREQDYSTRGTISIFATQEDIAAKKDRDNWVIECYPMPWFEKQDMDRREVEQESDAIRDLVYYTILCENAIYGNMVEI